jgi:hypothetical protein
MRRNEARGVTIVLCHDEIHLLVSDEITPVVVRLKLNTKAVVLYVDFNELKRLCLALLVCVCLKFVDFSHIAADFVHWPVTSQQFYLDPV